MQQQKIGDMEWKHGGENPRVERVKKVKKTQGGITQDKKWVLWKQLFIPTIMRVSLRMWNRRHAVNPTLPSFRKFRKAMYWKEKYFLLISRHYQSSERNVAYVLRKPDNAGGEQKVRNKWPYIKRKSSLACITFICGHLSSWSRLSA